MENQTFKTSATPVALDRHAVIAPPAPHSHQGLPHLRTCFHKAVLKGGIPERVYWDNGAVYPSRPQRWLATRLDTQAASTPAI